MYCRFAFKIQLNIWRSKNHKTVKFRIDKIACGASTRLRLLLLQFLHNDNFISTSTPGTCIEYNILIFTESPALFKTSIKIQSMNGGDCVKMRGFVDVNGRFIEFLIPKAPIHCTKALHWIFYERYIANELKSAKWERISDVWFASSMYSSRRVESTETDTEKEKDIDFCLLRRHIRVKPSVIPIKIEFFHSAQYRITEIRCHRLGCRWFVFKLIERGIDQGFHHLFTFFFVEFAHRFQTIRWQESHHMIALLNSPTRKKKSKKIWLIDSQKTEFGLINSHPRIGHGGIRVTAALKQDHFGGFDWLS